MRRQAGRCTLPGTVTDSEQRDLFGTQGLAHGAIINRVRASPGLDAGFCAPAHEVESRCIWVEPAEVAYDADDSGGCIWSFRRRSDHPLDLQEHAHHARGRSTVSG